jgi:hypothetical protein
MSNAFSTVGTPPGIRDITQLVQTYRVSEDQRQEDLLDLKGFISIEKNSGMLASTLQSYVWKYVFAFFIYCYSLIIIHDQRNSSPRIRLFNGRHQGSSLKRQFTASRTA